ncbi:hypothetical protein PULV_b0130 [Pseudoalteromonas ulvae UL12]|nr:hypothetical protein [Pseudoalteromonas ulvae UL12]
MKNTALNERPWTAELQSVQEGISEPNHAGYVHIKYIFEDQFD